eukprot:13542631-Alexandrium_andersonii.AAC.1
MSTIGTPPAGDPEAGLVGPRDAGLELASGSRPCLGTPPLPDAAEMKLEVLEQLAVPCPGGRARDGAPPGASAGSSSAMAPSG